MSNQELARVCASCGASNASEAQFCGMCGRELPEVTMAGEDAVFQDNPDGHPWQSSGSPPTFDVVESGDTDSNDLGGMVSTVQTPAEGIQKKRCDWCGGMNPWTVAVCESCGARFPIPEQDEAFRRAAEERLRQEEANLDRWRQRKRRPWPRFF
jgi:ribosomal protein L40E